jgi:hypothetical protein
MADEIKNGMHCAEFETLLFDAVDGTLMAGTLMRFRTHASGCASCGPLFADAQAGQQWLRSLVEVEPPKNLVHNILAKTSGVEERYQEQVVERKPSRFALALGWLQPVLAGTWATVRQPRFGMSVAMAFFSVSLVMSVAGIKVNDLAKVDLRPSAVRRTYYSTQARVVKYYTNMRVFYEIESRVRDVQRATTPAESRPRERERDRNPDKEQHKENNTSGRPSKGQERNGDLNQDRNQYRNGDRNSDQNYASDESEPVVAQADEAGKAREFETGDADGSTSLCSDVTRRNV